ncbi:hypothetical protein [Solibacillus sp. CAU 1738]|uniref:hypothetical protein n=1 Tax=Solibacillus sp. CAU 1738 TaxID=3140363 RepID=UPI0032619E74
MNERWKDVLIFFILGLLCFMAATAFIDIFLIKGLAIDGGVLIGFIGAILGGLISGGITFLGVKLTIKHDKNTEGLKALPEKIRLINELRTKHNLINNVLFHPIIPDYPKEIDRLLEDYIDVYDKCMKVDIHLYYKYKDIVQALSELKQSELMGGQLAKSYNLISDIKKFEVRKKLKEFIEMLKEYEKDIVNELG